MKLYFFPTCGDFNSIFDLLYSLKHLLIDLTIAVLKVQILTCFLWFVDDIDLFW